MIQNPWPLITQSGNNYILQIDQFAVSNHNYKANDNHKFHSELIPEPFIGNISAAVVALNANPGYMESDVNFHNTPKIQKIMMDNLSHDYSGLYYLSKEFDNSGGAYWWRRKLRRLIEDSSMESVSKNLLVIESMAYHSKKFKFINLPSQQYSCQLVKMAIDRGAYIIIMRSKNVWFELIPRLKIYKNLIIMNNPQQTYFSPGNMPRYNDVAEILSRSI
jgi:hypothetical protein